MVNKAPVPVGEIALDLHLDGPSRIYAELYAGKHLMQLEPGTKLYAGQPGLEWPKLDKPALIGGAIVGKGCSAGQVVMIAQRAYQYAAEHSPEEHARREQAFREVLEQIRGQGEQFAMNQDEANLAIGTALNRACDELPAGWSIQIELEKDAGVVTLYDPMGAPQDVEDGETFSESLDNAIELAVALDVEYRLEGGK